LDALIYTFIYIIIFLFGIVIGSFLNVLIFRIPKQEEFVKTRSHCMTCGHQLAWYDNIPLFSWLSLKGKCRYCGAPISPQYPIIEAVNGILYVCIFLIKGFTADAVLISLLASMLLALSVIDFRTFEIPFGFQIAIGVLAIAHLALHYTDWAEYVIGFFAVSLVLEILLLASKGRAIGGGDVKLMATCGLFLGWKLIILAFIVGCILGSVIHIIRMRVSKADKVLAMGPYLSAGVMIAALFGEKLISLYLGMFH